jgi:hypothetical protein
MADDIVPSLLKVINQQFDAQANASKKLRNAARLLKNSKATYRTANSFAIDTGNILAEILKRNLTVANLPDQQLYYNIANRVLNSTLKKNFDLISGFSGDVQKLLNEQAEIRLKVQAPTLNQDRIDGLVNTLSDETDFDRIKSFLEDPVINFCQSIVDDSIDANCKFQSKVGLHPLITRRLMGKACDWCKNLAGTYDYADLPEDIYRRHLRCRCVVEYDPGTGKRQNVWSKKWHDTSQNDKIKARKIAGLTVSGNGSVIKMNLQFFSEKDLSRQSTTSLQRGVRNLQSEIELHRQKIASPEQFVAEWESYSPVHKQGLIKHWNKEISNFSDSVENRKQELKKRGETYDQ